MVLIDEMFHRFLGYLQIETELAKNYVLFLDCSVHDVNLGNVGNVKLNNWSHKQLREVPFEWLNGR